MDCKMPCNDYRHSFLHGVPHSGPVTKVKSYGSMTPAAFYGACVRELEKEAGPIRFKAHWGRACGPSMSLKPWDMSWGQPEVLRMAA